MSGAALDETAAPAVAFVAAHGSAFQARFAEALAGAPSAGVREAVAAGQRDTGAIAWPPGGAAAAHEVAALRETAAALDALAALGVHEGICVEHAAGWLAVQQQREGSFAGDLDLTADLAATLARSPCARPALLARAMTYVAARFTPELAEDAGAARLSALAGCYALLPTEGADEALQWIGRTLEKGWRSRRLAPEQVACLLARASAHAFPAAAIEPGELLASLLAAQGADGGWPGESVPARVASTLAALRGRAHLEGRRC